MMMMICILPLSLCCGIVQADLQGCDNPGQEQGGDVFGFVPVTDSSLCGPCCGGLGLFSFPHAMYQLNPMFLCSAFLQQRFGPGTRFAPISLVPISSLSLPFLSPDV